MKSVFSMTLAAAVVASGAALADPATNDTTAASSLTVAPLVTREFTVQTTKQVSAAAAEATRQAAAEADAERR